MEIKLTNEESEEYFYNALSNGGLSLLENSGIILSYDKDQYKLAAEKLTDSCFEDVLMQILIDGNKLSFIDLEGDGEYSREVTLELVHQRVNKMPQKHLLDLVQENDDAITADVLLQSVLYDGEIIFG